MFDREPVYPSRTYFKTSPSTSRQVRVRPRGSLRRSGSLRDWPISGGEAHSPLDAMNTGHPASIVAIAFPSSPLRKRRCDCGEQSLRDRRPDLPGILGSSDSSGV